MGSFSRAAANWSEGGYGAMVSVPAVHPGLLGAISPDSTPGALKQLMLQVQHGSASVIFTRDTGSGSVGIDSEGRPVVRYWPDDTTSKHLLDVSLKWQSTRRCSSEPTSYSGSVLFNPQQPALPGWHELTGQPC